MNGQCTTCNPMDPSCNPNLNCMTDNDCAMGETCVANVCQQSCNSMNDPTCGNMCSKDADCGMNGSCVNGICQ